MKNIFLPISFGLFGLLSSVSSPEPPQKQIAIKIPATPIDRFDPENPSCRRFGALEYRGGLVLTSTDKLFGGISALRLQPDGSHFIALSDHGFWLRGRIVYSGNQPAGLDEAVMAPVLDPNGKPSDQWDTESLAEDNGLLYVGIERRNFIMRYDYARKGLLARAEPIDVPSCIKDLPSNQGLEAMVFMPRNLPLGRTLIAFSEHGLDASGNLTAFLIGGSTPGTFSVKRTQEFDISDAALLPDGDLLILERKYFVTEGVSLRIRRLRQAEIKPGSLVDGPVLVQADRRYEIDNMEGLSVHRSKSGEIIITLISDNNYSMVQRTILLQFALMDN
jgi:hypothetical protein